MRLALQTVICWCVFTAVMPLVKGGKEDFNSSLKNRFRVWLQSRVRRDLGGGFETASEGHSDIPGAPQQKGDTGDAPQLQSSFGSKVRPRRSSGCRLPTCVFPELIKKLTELTAVKDTAPQEKVGCKGYGRRRRSTLDPHARLTVRTRTPSSRWSNGTGRGGRHAAPPTLD